MVRGEIANSNLRLLPQFGYSNFSSALNNGIAYVGTTNTLYAMVFGFDYRVPGYPRLVSAMGYGDSLDQAVLTFGFYQSQMFLGGSLISVPTRQVDISQPRNVINLYYPGFTGGSGQLRRPGTGRRSVLAHPKLRSISSRRGTAP